MTGIKFTRLENFDLDLLIGADVPAAYRIFETRYGQDGQPSTVLTGLGWTLIDADKKMTASECHQINWVRQVKTVSEPDLHE